MAAGVVLAGTAGCGASSESSCAIAFVRDGTTYYPHEAAERLPQGRTLGEVASSTCDDGSGESEAEYREAVAIRGVDPQAAFIVPAEGEGTLFAPGPPDGSELALQVQELLKG